MAQNTHHMYNYLHYTNCFILFYENAKLLVRATQRIFSSTEHRVEMTEKFVQPLALLAKEICPSNKQTSIQRRFLT